MYKYICLFLILIVCQDCSENSTGSDEIYPTKDLVAHFSFTGNANDISDHNHNGTVYGATLVQDHNGIDSSAYFFNGSNNYILVDQDDEFLLARKGAVFAWIKPEYTGDNVSILSNGSTNSPLGNCYDMVLNRYSNQWEILAYVGGQQINKRPNPNLHDYGEWYFVTYQWESGGNVSLFVNGILEYEEQLIEENNPDNNTTLQIGLLSSSYYKGIIDDLVIYKRIFAEEEIQEIYLFTTK